MAPDLPRLARVLLASLAEPGLGLVHQLLTEHDPERVFTLAVEERLPENLNAPGKLAGRDPLEYAAAVLAETGRLGARVLIPGDPEWPSRLDDLAAVADGPGSHGPPFCIWAKGPLDLDTALRRSVAVVGSRDASSYGRHMAHEFGYGLASREWTVVSGGALGIDSAAHQGALHAEGPTVAVLACGIDVAYPAQNDRLFASIAEHGLVLSEWPPGACPLKHRFLIRNRLIAAATLGTVVVEATVRSGARNTARHAVELERPLMVMPGPVNAKTSLGVHELAREPAGARIVTRAAEIIEDLGALGADLAEPRRGPETVLDQLDELSARVLDAVPRRTATLAEQIAAQAGVSPRDARRTLPKLLMLGLVTEDDGRYRQAPAAVNPARVRPGGARTPVPPRRDSAVLPKDAVLPKGAAMQEDAVRVSSRAAAGRDVPSRGVTSSGAPRESSDTAPRRAV